MRRRDFITLLGGTVAAWPAVANAQQPAWPVIGFVSSGDSSPNGPFSPLRDAFLEGLKDRGYAEDSNIAGRKIAIVYHFAHGDYKELPALLSDVIDRHVSLIVAAGGLPPARDAKELTATIPILFIAGFDPVKVGLVASFGHPGGNATGVSVNTTEMAQKRVEMLRNLMPELAYMAALVNPKSTAGVISKLEGESIEEVSRKFGMRRPLILDAGTDDEIDRAFARAREHNVEALSVSGDPFYTLKRAKIVELAARYQLPTIYPWREFVDAGGMMSYGPNLTWAYKEIGRYAGRILDGAKPSDLPVQLPTDFHYVINLKTATALRLTVPPMLEASAEVIE